MTSWRCRVANVVMVLFGLAILAYLAAGNWSMAALTGFMFWWSRRFFRRLVIV